jgi:hypothetical protein
MITLFLAIASLAGSSFRVRGRGIWVSSCVDSGVSGCVDICRLEASDGKSDGCSWRDIDE